MKSCNQCGKCCLRYSAGSGLGSATKREVELWEENRPEILDYTDSLGDLWVSPITGEETDRCPWLRKLLLKNTYKCRIHNLRPDACHSNPYSIDQMIRDDCEMLEEGDLEKPREELLAELEALRNMSEDDVESMRNTAPSKRYLSDVLEEI